MNRSRIIPLFGRRRPNQFPQPTPFNRRLWPDKPTSIEVMPSSSGSRIHFEPRVGSASTVRLVSAHRHSDLGELSAFLSLSLAGMAAILVAVFLNWDFPIALDQVAKRLSSPSVARGTGIAAFGSSAPLTNRTALPFDTATGDLENSDAQERKASPRSVPLPAQAPKPSV